MSDRAQDQIDLAACCAGEKRAWDRFVERTAPIIYASVRRTIGGGSPRGATADDIAQDVFVRLVKSDYRLLKSFDANRASLSTWLTLVARSTAIDHLRRKRLDTVPFDDATDLGDREPRTSAPSGQAELDSGTIPLHILTSRQRLVLTMLLVEDRPVPEVARMLDVDAQTVRSTKHKALEKLREHAAEPP